ncbi:MULTISPECIES: hypothetical protein [Pseudomonas]|jgi:hypothetical protein|uniref:hypothetical protein n=1 Tax=Pseudomonas TaxID=286 RepID=UPI0018E8F7DE|nr:MULTISPECIES: hypothetical protein [Pseudomonas]MBJ2214082.1 hypothetical protein [Pseudomonas carnis]MBP5947950.1 hypothetical protein [Pseudomonas sp. P9(2020)]
MKTAYQLELSVMRDRLWIHSTADGSTVGRFGRMGIDLHNTMTEQMAGKPQCRLCTHQRPTVADWLVFRERAKEWWGVEVPRDAFDEALLLPTPGTESHDSITGSFE